MHRKYTLYILSILLFCAAQAQAPVMLWVEFRDKNYSPYSLSRPQEFLSQRSLERRQQQLIPLNDTDLPVSPYYLSILDTIPDVQVFYTSRWLNGALLRIATEQQASLVSNLDFIVYAENVKSAPPPKISLPAEKQGGEGYGTVPAGNPHLSFPYPLWDSDIQYPSYGAANEQISLVNGEDLHQRGFWGTGLKIAVLDAGFRYVDSLDAFQYLWKHNRIKGWRDIVNPGGNVFREHPHGLYVLSVMGAYLPGEYSGAALGASYWLIRTEDASSEHRIEEYNWLAGAELADSLGADIINSSLGYTTFDNPAQSYSYEQLNGKTTVVARAAGFAFDKGILVVNSAGNYGAQSWRYIGSPADSDGVLAVGGTTGSGIRAGFSSLGPAADGRTKPDIMAQGQAVAVINQMGSISKANGTSFSSPMVAALAACLWQNFPEVTAAELMQAIIKSADRYLNPDTLYGYGIPDFALAAMFLNKHQPISHKLQIIKNPVSSASSLRIYASEYERINIEVYGAGGQRIFSLGEFTLYSGFNHLHIFEDFDSLSSGIYFVKVNYRNRTEIVKAVRL